jgi:hypothetical protein
MVSKFKPCRFGSRNVLRCESHVPSPTYMESALYTLVPGADKPWLDMVLAVAAMSLRWNGAGEVDALFVGLG